MPRLALFRPLPKNSIFVVCVLRISLHFYNAMVDIGRLMAGLRTATRSKPEKSAAGLSVRLPQHPFVLGGIVYLPGTHGTSHDVEIVKIVAVNGCYWMVATRHNRYIAVL